MTPTKLLIGQIILVFAIVILGVQWTAVELGYHWQFGVPWSAIVHRPVYHAWRLFQLRYALDAYASKLFAHVVMIAAASGFVGFAVVMTRSPWRAHQKRVCGGIWLVPLLGYSTPPSVFLSQRNQSQDAGFPHSHRWRRTERSLATKYHQKRSSRLLERQSRLSRPSGTDLDGKDRSKGAVWTRTRREEHDGS